VDPDAAPLSLAFDGADLAEAVDVPLHVVTPQRLAGAERGLEVDARAGDEPAERGAGERLRNGVENERAVDHRDGGQTAAVDGDGIADRSHLCERRSLELEPQPAVATLRGDDPPHLAHDPCEHAAQAIPARFAPRPPRG